MNEFIRREGRAAPDFPPEHQLIAFPSNPQPNNMVPDAVYFEGRYGSKFPGMPLGGNTNGAGFMSIVHANASPYPHAGMNVAVPAGQGQIVSGIDPAFLAAYATNNAAYITTGELLRERHQAPSGFGTVYQDRSVAGPNPSESMRDRSQAPSGLGTLYQNSSFAGPERNKSVACTPQLTSGESIRDRSQAPSTLGTAYQNSSFTGPERNKSVAYTPQLTSETQTLCQESFSTTPRNTSAMESKAVNDTTNTAGSSSMLTRTTLPSVQQSVTSTQKSEKTSVKAFEQTQVNTPAEKFKALHKSGPRAFSGPVEKVLKWHKALQDIGLLVIYELVAKCVSVRPGESCAKHLVIREDSGPAMQVVYYEVEFLLPELKPPCTVRVVGRMMPGTCRLQAFNVRPATGDDVATLPRRAAVAAHHVSKLCKEFNINM